MESEVDEFIRFVRSQRLPVPSSHMKACEIRAAKEQGLDKLKASNDWLENYLGRKGVQSSFKIHGKGSAELPANSKERMAAIRSTLSSYTLSNAYNMDESALF